MTRSPVHRPPFSSLEQPSSGPTPVVTPRITIDRDAFRLLRLVLLRHGGGTIVTLPIPFEAPSNFSLKLSAGRFTNPVAEPPRLSQDARRHAARERAEPKCGERRAALAACTRGLAAA